MLIQLSVLFLSLGLLLSFELPKTHLVISPGRSRYPGSNFNATTSHHVGTKKTDLQGDELTDCR